jgi:hypothetical protein
MSDLSKVLGDLYDGGEATPRPGNDFRAAAPAWADEDRLDEAFSEWTPGPPDDAHETEREMSVVLDMPAVPAARLDEDMAATLSAALAQAATEPPAPAWDASPVLPQSDSDSAPVWDPMPAAAGRVWQRIDDDILPGASGRVHKQQKIKGPKASAPLRLPKLGKESKLEPVVVPAAHSEPVAPGEKPPLKVFGLQLRRK